MKKLNFDELSLSSEMQEAIAEMGFTVASQIQAEAIPYILEGKDVIGQAQTGTGKTAAFGIPLLEMIDAKDKSVQSVVLCPTRELAVQVSNELKKLAKFKRGLHVLPIYGGESIERQIGALKRGVQVIVGTPGRVMDHLDRKTLSFANVKMIVLDEADEMLNMGFREDIEVILTKMPEERQTVFFSATMPKAILDLVHKYQDKPKMIKVTNNEITNASIEQVYFDVVESQKSEVISRLIQLHNLQLMLVFCNTKRKVDDVVQELRAKGHKAEGIHGDLRQNQRNMVLSMFRKSEVTILVATDVAARGIDVSNVDAVFNYDLPLDPEYYVHRIGRTGRAGKSGIAFSFVTGRNELRLLKDIQAYTKVSVTRRNLPTAKELIDTEKVKLLGKLKEVTKEGDVENFEEIVSYFRKEGFTLHELSVALLKLTLGEEKELSEVKHEERRFERSDRSDRGSRDRDRDRDRGDRGDRERRPRKRTRNDNMVRLFLNCGKKDRISPKDIAGTLVGKSGMEFSGIGVIDIYDSYSFVEVSKTSADKVMESLKNHKIKGRKVNVEIAKG